MSTQKDTKNIFPQTPTLDAHWDAHIENQAYSHHKTLHLVNSVGRPRESKRKQSQKQIARQPLWLATYNTKFVFASSLLLHTRVLARVTKSESVSILGLKVKAHGAETNLWHISA